MSPHRTLKAAQLQVLNHSLTIKQAANRRIESFWTLKQTEIASQALASFAENFSLGAFQITPNHEIARAPFDSYQ